MLDEPHECAAVLQQIAAIRGAVNGLMREVIKGHLTEHIVHQSDEARREEDLDVILKVLDSYKIAGSYIPAIFYFSRKTSPIRKVNRRPT